MRTHDSLETRLQQLGHVLEREPSAVGGVMGRIASMRGVGEKRPPQRRSFLRPIWSAAAVAVGILVMLFATSFDKLTFSQVIDAITKAESMILTIRQPGPDGLIDEDTPAGKIHVQAVGNLSVDLPQLRSWVKGDRFHCYLPQHNLVRTAIIKDKPTRIFESFIQGSLPTFRDYVPEDFDAEINHGKVSFESRELILIERFNRHDDHTRFKTYVSPKTKRPVSQLIFVRFRPEQKWRLRRRDDYEFNVAIDASVFAPKYPEGVETKDLGIRSYKSLYASELENPGTDRKLRLDDSQNLGSLPNDEFAQRLGLWGLSAEAIRGLTQVDRLALVKFKRAYALSEGQNHKIVVGEPFPESRAVFHRHAGIGPQFERGVNDSRPPDHMRFLWRDDNILEYVHYGVAESLYGVLLSSLKEDGFHIWQIAADPLSKRMTFLGDLVFRQGLPAVKRIDILKTAFSQQADTKVRLRLDTQSTEVLVARGELRGKSVNVSDGEDRKWLMMRGASIKEQLDWLSLKSGENIVCEVKNPFQPVAFEVHEIDWSNPLIVERVLQNIVTELGITLKPEVREIPFVRLSTGP